MIIKSLLNLLYNVFSALTSAISIPSLPENIETTLNAFLSDVEFGLQILANYTHLKYLLSLFGIVVAIEVGISIYHFVMWVLKKIPMLGIS